MKLRTVVTTRLNRAELRALKHVTAYVHSFCGRVSLAEALRFLVRNWTDWAGNASLQKQGWLILHPDGSVETDYFGMKWPTKDQLDRPMSQKRWMATYRPQCSLVLGTLTWTVPAALPGEPQ
jgi:hypothetical protein